MEDIRKGLMKMDELKLKLSTRFMRGIVAKLVSKAISKKMGYDIDILINEIEAKMEDGNVNFHADVDVKVSEDEFKKIMKSISI